MIFWYFWVSLAGAFAVMSILSLRLRRKMPSQIAAANATGDSSGPDMRTLAPVFNEMLVLEFLAFVLTSIAALISALS